jgi:hypothetical protein
VWVLGRRGSLGGERGLMPAAVAGSGGKNTVTDSVNYRQDLVRVGGHSMGTCQKR